VKLNKGLDELASKIGGITVGAGGEIGTGDASFSTATATVHVPTSYNSGESADARRRRIVNEAERKWREEEKASRYVDRAQQDWESANWRKTGKSIKDDPRTWNTESDQLANELAELAKEMTGLSPAPATAEAPAPAVAPPVTQKRARPVVQPTKKPLKYQPRLPAHLRAKTPRAGKVAGGQLDGADETDVDYMDVEVS
jgi:hypothetical protein